MDDLHDLTALYIVDALDDVERRRYEGHLPTCAECRAELELLEGGFGRYLDDAARAAPSSIKAGVMSALPPQAGPRRRFPGLVAGIAAAAAAVSVVVAVAIGGEPDLVEQIYGADDVVELAVEGSPFPGTTIVYSREVGRVLFVAGELPDPGEDRTYQLWLIDDDGPRSAGTFRPEGDQTTVVLEGIAEAGSVVGLTVEPGDGSTQPTGEVLIAQPLA